MMYFKTGTKSHDCYLLDSIGDIYIVNIQINQQIVVANDVRVERIEAHEMLQKEMMISI